MKSWLFASGILALFGLLIANARAVDGETPVDPDWAALDDAVGNLGWESRAGILEAQGTIQGAVQRLEARGVDGDAIDLAIAHHLELRSRSPATMSNRWTQMAMQMNGKLPPATGPAARARIAEFLLSRHPRDVGVRAEIAATLLEPYFLQSSQGDRDPDRRWLPEDAPPIITAVAHDLRSHPTGPLAEAAESLLATPRKPDPRAAALLLSGPILGHLKAVRADRYPAVSPTLLDGITRLQLWSPEISEAALDLIRHPGFSASRSSQVGPAEVFSAVLATRPGTESTLRALSGLVGALLAYTTPTARLAAWRDIRKGQGARSSPTLLALVANELEGRDRDGVRAAIDWLAHEPSLSPEIHARIHAALRSDVAAGGILRFWPAWLAEHMPRVAPEPPAPGAPSSERMLPLTEQFLAADDPSAQGVLLARLERATAGSLPEELETKLRERVERVLSERPSSEELHAAVGAVAALRALGAPGGATERALARVAARQGADSDELSRDLRRTAFDALYERDRAHALEWTTVEILASPWVQSLAFGTEEFFRLADLLMAHPEHPERAQALLRLLKTGFIQSQVEMRKGVRIPIRQLAPILRFFNDPARRVAASFLHGEWWFNAGPTQTVVWAVAPELAAAARSSPHDSDTRGELEAAVGSLTLDTERTRGELVYFAPEVDVIHGYVFARFRDPRPPAKVAQLGEPEREQIPEREGQQEEAREYRRRRAQTAELLRPRLEKLIAFELRDSPTGPRHVRAKSLNRILEAMDLLALGQDPELLARMEPLLRVRWEDPSALAAGRALQLEVLASLPPESRRKPEVQAHAIEMLESLPAPEQLEAFSVLSAWPLGAVERTRLRAWLKAKPVRQHILEARPALKLRIQALDFQWCVGEKMDILIPRRTGGHLPPGD